MELIKRVLEKIFFLDPFEGLASIVNIECKHGETFYGEVCTKCGEFIDKDLPEAN